MTEFSEEVTRRLRAAFEPHRDETRAAAMTAYMRNLFPFLGITGPERAALHRHALAGLPRPGAPDLESTARRLWALPEREYQYAACDILRRNVRTLDGSFLRVARGLIETKSWWDTVDSLASNVVGLIVRRHPELNGEMDKWAADPNFWIARTAILHQLKFKLATDPQRLFSYCDLRASDTEFFIRKAIGWALREYSKTDAEAVRRFVTEHEAELSGLSKREALLWLNGGRKARAADLS